jgi:DnaJ-class molecular chaperone
MTYQDFKKAIETFGLGERANLTQIKDKHRELVKAHHPDKAKAYGPEAIREINSAYEILMEYCNSYQFCFSEKEFLEQTPTERLKRQFGWDPVWGGKNESQED